ncbi:tetratricopeptide repeat protein [Sphingomonas jaspsi]|uniref:tetratricopeptide repeat protein n=1 Tax=Sphingomonas jaspsi TaxID=392409 RepID=UPI0004ADAC02|nr:tetratricopeptide repeat protein [Sphingomonas jaspsi]
MRFKILIPLMAMTALTGPALAKAPPTPEQRIDRLEKQVRQVQKQVFPKGQPADTAGFSDDPAATQDSVNGLMTRLDAIERQMADIVRTSEENANRVSTLETELFRMRADYDKRLRGVENGGDANPAGDDSAEPVQETTNDGPPPPSRPKVENNKRDPKPAAVTPVSPASSDFDAAGEAAYDAGFQLWQQGKYDQAITALNAMAKKYPGHRRESWAYNLAGRAMLDKGQPRAAAEALLANYRRDPKGERAQDSVFYLGKSLMKLGQAGQACKAYAELEEVYRGQIRPQLAAELPAAKAEARCR